MLSALHTDTLQNTEWSYKSLRQQCYEGESVNTSQMAIERKTCDIRIWGKNVYFSTYPPPTLTTCPIALPVRRNPQSFHCCLSHFITSVSTSSSSAKRLPPSCELLYATNTSPRKQKTFLLAYTLHWAILPRKKRKTESCSLVVNLPSTVAILITKTSLWTCACASAT
jgi:hypothetical protein